MTLPRLEEARREAKNGTQLARKLMDAFWDHETLARSSLSNKKYQQLDPNVINAIEGIILLHCKWMGHCVVFTMFSEGKYEMSGW